MDKQLKIVYRSFGIADKFPDNTIELNKHLDKYPQLKKSLIEHEIRHTNNMKFNRKDLEHDLATRHQLDTWKLMKFILRHPFSLVQFVPIYYHRKRKGWIVDNNLLIGWVVLIVIILIGLAIGNVI